MKRRQEVSGPSDSLPKADRTTVSKSSIDSSPQNSENNYESDVNDENEFVKTQTTSSEKCNSETGEEQIVKRQLNSQVEPEVINSAEPNQINPQQEKSSMKSTFSVADITPDDEIYTLQLPRNYNNQYLCNIDFKNFNKSNMSKSEEFKVEILNPDKKFICLAVPKSNSSGSLLKIPLKGHIVIQKCVNIEDVKHMEEDAYDKDTVAFPDDIKVRHPLLGTNWKAHVELACTAFSRSSLSKKSKSRKRERIKLEEKVDVDEVEIKNFKQKNELEFVPCKKKFKKNQCYGM